MIDGFQGLNGTTFSSIVWQRFFLEIAIRNWLVVTTKSLDLPTGERPKSPSSRSFQAISVKHLAAVLFSHAFPIACRHLNASRLRFEMLVYSLSIFRCNFGQYSSLDLVKFTL